MEIDADSDGDGKKDRVHVDVSRPRETDTDGLKVPVIYEDSPYYAGGADVANWAVDHEIGAPPATPHPRARLHRRQHEPEISTRYEATWVPRGFAVVHSESPGTGNSDGCPNSGAPIETLGATAVIDWLNGRAKGYTTRAGTDEVSAYWTTGNVGMMGTSYNGTIPIAAAIDRRRGPEGDRPDLGDLGLVRLLPRQRHGPRAAPPGGSDNVQGEDLDVLDRVRLLAQRRGPAPHEVLADDRRRSRPTRTA